MTPLIIPAAVLALVTFGFLFGRQGNATISLRVSGDGDPFTRGYFRGLLRQGRLYRFWVRIEPEMQALMKKVPRRRDMTDEAFLVETMKPIARRLGFQDPLLVTHDPTDSGVWTMLVRWACPADEVLSARYITPLKLEPVEEPPVHEIDKNGVLDRFLTQDEVWAVVYALGKDDDTKHLGGFAMTFEPDYPIAANLLKAKSLLAAIRSYRSPRMKAEGKSAEALVKVLQKASQGLGPEAERGWEKYKDIVLTEQNQKGLGAVVRDLGAAQVRKRAGKSPLPIKITPAALQLSLSTRRPTLSHVSNPDGIRQKLQAIYRAADAGDPKGIEAKEKIVAAERFMERRKWVDWYKQLTDNQNMPPGSLTGVLTSSKK